MEVVEKKENPPPIFSDYSPYQNLEGLPSEITNYIPPQAREDLREKIRPLIDVVNEEEKIILTSVFRFLERGIMVDVFEGNDDGRDRFYLSRSIRVGNKETTLYELSKKVNKLRGNAISSVITAAQLLSLLFSNGEGEQENSLYKKALELKENIENIDKERGYFKPEDLKEVDDLALEVIIEIARRHGIKIF